MEKAGGQRETNGRAHDTLLAMIEPESASAWFDECLRTTADLRNAVWIMAANETRGIPAPLLSRLSVHQVEPPPARAFPSVLAGLLSGIAAAQRLGAEYPIELEMEEDGFALLCFKLYYLLSHGKYYRARKGLKKLKGDGTGTGFGRKGTNRRRPRATRPCRRVR